MKGNEFEVLFNGKRELGDRMALMAMLTGDMEALRRIEVLMAVNTVFDGIWNHEDVELLQTLAECAEQVVKMDDAELLSYARSMDHEMNLRLEDL